VFAEDDGGEIDSGGILYLGVGNSFFGGAAGSSVFSRATQRLVEVKQNSTIRGVGRLAGVWFVRELLHEYRQRLDEVDSRIKVLPKAVISPMPWNERANHAAAADVCTNPDSMDLCRARCVLAVCPPFFESLIVCS
jgi:hypothetical protein